MHCSQQQDELISILREGTVTSIATSNSSDDLVAAFGVDTSVRNTDFVTLMVFSAKKSSLFGSSGFGCIYKNNKLRATGVADGVRGGSMVASQSHGKGKLLFNSDDSLLLMMRYGMETVSLDVNNSFVPKFRYRMYPYIKDDMNDFFCLSAFSSTDPNLLVQCSLKTDTILLFNHSHYYDSIDNNATSEKNSSENQNNNNDNINNHKSSSSGRYISAEKYNTCYDPKHWMIDREKDFQESAGILVFEHSHQLFDQNKYYNRIRDVRFNCTGDKIFIDCRERSYLRLHILSSKDLSILGTFADLENFQFSGWTLGKAHSSKLFLTSFIDPTADHSSYYPSHPTPETSSGYLIHFNDNDDDDDNNDDEQQKQKQVKRYSVLGGKEVDGNMFYQIQNKIKINGFTCNSNHKNAALDALTTALAPLHNRLLASAASAAAASRLPPPSSSSTSSSSSCETTSSASSCSCCSIEKIPSAAKDLKVRNDMIIEKSEVHFILHDRILVFVYCFPCLNYSSGRYCFEHEKPVDIRICYYDCKNFCWIKDSIPIIKIDAIRFSSFAISSVSERYFYIADCDGDIQVFVNPIAENLFEKRVGAFSVAKLSKSKLLSTAFEQWRILQNTCLFLETLENTLYPKKNLHPSKKKNNRK